ncbi:MAG: Na+/proline symporter [Ignavibacteria bacterium]|nr:MAG: Na+/proline symporter [Ignavibacteria bacterium]KAF0160651.1 MAG: Na+/proline symporter [Ignavibacteria bacterium]
MISFSSLDYLVIGSFFLILISIGFLVRNKNKNDSSEFLLSGRKMGLLLFVFTNVSTWYGGILGIGEFTYRYGILSWVTQGLPYYIFALLFAFFLAKKVNASSLFTIPDKLEETYGREVGLLSSILVFILVSPAPYLLMVGNLISIMFNINLFYGLLIGFLFSGLYLIKGGYKSDLFTDVFQFFVMFIGFILAVVISVNNYGGFEFLQMQLPASHLQFDGNVSIVYLVVWFLIALWTFADPGFHQRCYAAKSGNVAKWGIIISIALWALFDFLTTTTGLYARAVNPNLENPVLSFPVYAESSLGSGIKGLFYAAMFATILSTLNSFLFLSATTFGRDLVFKLSKSRDERRIVLYTRIGIIVSAVISIGLAYYVQSVVTIWYLIGSICIPPIIILIFGSYYQKMSVNKSVAISEIITSVLASLSWIHFREFLGTSWLYEVEPMIIGLITALIIHLYGIRMRLINKPH